MRWIVLTLFAAIVIGSVALYLSQPLPVDTSLKADKIIIYKSQRRLTMLHRDKIIKSYPISLGGNPIGTKTREGDSRTPEGTYSIDWRNSNSAFHLSLHISYPNAADRNQAAKKGVSPGGNIMIHGIRNGLGLLGIVHNLWDWTDGCIAVTNGQIREIWHAVPNGTVVDIRA